MPTTVNGIGTWYYGKSDRVEYHGTCSQCQAQTVLASYDTRLWFVFVFIPLIPLGRKHVLDECAACERHIAIPADEWKQALDKANEAARQYEEDPDSRDKALEALGARMALRDVVGFRALAPLLESRLGSEPEVLVCLASVHSGFGDQPERERLLRRAHELAPEDERWRESLAELLMDRGDADGAWPLLEHIERRGIPDKVLLILRLAEIHAAKANHREALRLFDVAENIEPRLGDDATFTALRDASRGKLGSAEPVMATELVNALERKRTMANVARFAPAVVGLVLGCYALVAMVRGAQREAWLVNGLARPYTVTLRGEKHRLEPGKPVKVVVGEGTVRLSADGPAARLGEQDLTIRTPFWSRPFASTEIVINPDHTAILRRARIYYGTHAPAPDDHQLHAGEVVTMLEDVDHAFEPPPRQLRSGKRSAAPSRVVLQALALGDMGPDQLEATARVLGRDRVVRLASRMLKLDPTDSGAYRALATVATPEEQIRELEPGLSERPVVMERHLAYQEAMGALGRDAEVEATYAKLVAAEPANEDLRYLAARTSRDPGTWETKLRELAAYSTARPFVVRSLALMLLTTGQSAEALEAARRYAKAAPKDSEAVHLVVWALLANGRADEALAELARAREAGNGRFADELLLLGSRGRQSDAKKLFASMARAVTDTDAQGTMKALMEGLIAYGAGREKEAGGLLSVGAHARLASMAAVMKGDLAAAAAAVEQDLDPAPALATFLALHRSGSGGTADAERMIAAAARKLRARGGHGGRVFADALEGKSHLPPDVLVRHFLREHVKPAVLAALGARSEKDRETYFALARRLNVWPAFPHLTVKAVVGGDAK